MQLPGTWGSAFVVLVGRGSEVEGWLASEVCEVILTGRGELMEGHRGGRWGLSGS